MLPRAAALTEPSALCQAQPEQVGLLLCPAGHHWVNVAWHAANSVLLFLLLSKLTGAWVRSGFVAGLFALHPLHVESVAWISERKDLLSTFFAWLTIWSYANHAAKVEGRGAAKNDESLAANDGRKPAFIPYLLTLFLFGLGLMSKPMLV